MVRNWQGHTSNEKFHKAQVFVTKFKDNNNELIDLFEGLIWNVCAKALEKKREWFRIKRRYDWPYVV
jgi:hypothetical protein